MEEGEVATKTDTGEDKEAEEEESEGVWEKEEPVRCLAQKRAARRRMLRVILHCSELLLTWRKWSKKSVQTKKWTKMRMGMMSLRRR